MKKIIKLFVLVLWPFFAFAQHMEWNKCYGGSDDDMAYAIIPSHNGGFLIAGNTRSDDGDISMNHGSSDFWVIKIDDNGEILWEETYGTGVYESASAITGTQDGNYIVAGRKNMVGGDPMNTDFWIVKINDSGGVIWQKSFGGSSFDIPSHITMTFDNNYIISGITHSSDGDVTGNEPNKQAVWILKINASGDLLWESSFLVSDCVNFGSTVTSPDHGIVFTADVCDGNSNYLIVKLDEFGDLVWQKEYGGSLNDHPHAIKPTYGGGYIVVGAAASDDGYVFGNHGSFDYWAVIIDEEGELVSSHCFGGSDPETAYDVIPKNNTEFIMVGVAESDNGDLKNEDDFGDFWIVDIDFQYNILWELCLGDSLGREVATSLVPMGNSSYLVAGYSCTQDGEIVTDNHGGADFWVVKVTEGSTSVENTNDLIGCNIHPNPTSGILSIETPGLRAVDIIDIQGKVVFRTEVNPDHLNLSGLTKGLYFLKVQTMEGVIVEKVILE